jgi:hypothetical protein
MSPRKPTEKPALDVKAGCELLEQMLRAQLEGHKRLLSCIERKRLAIRTADIDSIAAICGEENTLIQKLGEVEKRRIELIGRFTAHFAPKAPIPLTVSQIADAVGDPASTRLLAHAAQLKDMIRKVRRESSIVRTAADALNRHMTGIVQTVNGALSKARVYGNRGRIVVGAQMQTSVDIKS